MNHKTIMNNKYNSQTNRRAAALGQGLVLCALGAAFVWPVNAQRSLPFPPKRSGSTAERTMQESTYSPLPPVSHLPKDAPNILIVLIDDVGPAQTDTYGGEIHTPTLSRIAKEGISYNRFHTTAMCSPTRAALLTGRNHHRVGNGQIAELANDWDGYTGMIPKSSATVAEVLRNYGYATGAWGKWHNTPAWRPPPPARSITGPPVMALSISTDFSAAKPRNTSRSWCATQPTSSIRTLPAGTIITT